jgi:hypothetical protein
MTKKKTEDKKLTGWEKAGIVAGIIGTIATIVAMLVSGVNNESSLYRVRVIVISPDQIPVEDAKVWSSFGGEPKKVAGGWQFDIPEASIPKKTTLTFYASKETAFLKGQEKLVLGNDFNPVVTIQLKKKTSSVVRGIVLDSESRAIEGVHVTIAGYKEKVITAGDGHFVLHTPQAKGQQVLIHAEKQGYKPVTQWHQAGDEPATIVLDKQF